MDKIKELQAKLKAKYDEMKELSLGIDAAEKEEDKETARKAFETVRSEVNSIKADLDKVLEQVQLDKEINTSLDKAGEYSSVNLPEKGKLTGGSAEAKDHDKDLRLKEGICLKYLSDGIEGISGEEHRAMQPEEGGKLGQSEKTTKAICLPKSFTIKMMGADWACKVGMHPQEVKRIMKASTMVSSSLTLGGYTIPEDFRLPMLDLAVEQTHILPRASVMPAPTGEITMPKSVQTDSDEYGGMVGEWIEEAGLKPKTDTRFEQVKVATHEYAMHTQISIRLLNRSAIAMEGWLSTRGRQVILDAADKAFINGDGSGKPLGYLQTDGIREHLRETVGTVTRKDLTKLKYKLKPFHRANAIYVLDDSVLEALEDLTDNEGRQLFTASMANGPYDRIGGYPYITTTRTPDIGTDGDAAFIDLREYYVPMEQDIMIKRSDDYDIVHNVATIVMFAVMGGELVQPRTCAILGDEESS